MTYSRRISAVGTIFESPHISVGTQVCTVRPGPGPQRTVRVLRKNVPTVGEEKGCSDSKYATSYVQLLFLYIRV